MPEAAGSPYTKKAVADKQLKLRTKRDTKHPNIWEQDVKTLGKIMNNM